MATYKGSWYDAGIEPPEGLSILTGKNIVPGFKRKRIGPPPAGEEAEGRPPTEREQPTPIKPRRHR